MTFKEIILTPFIFIGVVISAFIVPAYYTLKYFVRVSFIKHGFKRYRFYQTHGGFILTNKFTKKNIEDTYMLFLIPDKTAFTMFYRMITFKRRFVVTMSFDEYIGCNKLGLMKLYATVNDYKKSEIEIKQDLKYILI